VHFSYLDNENFEEYFISVPEQGVQASTGRTGDAYDNAETINGLFKAEVIRRNGTWKGVDDVEFATLEWVDWFNNRRILEPIGNVPPAEFEVLYYKSINGSARAA